MAKVLKADAAGPAEAYIELELPGDEPDVWITLEVAFDAATLALWEVEYSGYMAGVLSVGYATGVSTYIQPPGEWALDGSLGGGTPVADTWTLLEVHVTDPDSELYVDGPLLLSGDVTGFGQARFVRVGQWSPEGGVFYAKNVKAGTTRGGTDLLASDGFDSETFAAWTTTVGDVSIVDDPYPSAPELQGLCIAPDDPWNEPNPTWIRLDDPEQDWRLRVNNVSISRGSDSDTDTVKTGWLAATCNDPFGTLDPTNTGSPFWDVGNAVTKLDPGIQAAYARWNPVTEEWTTRFRGFVKRIRYRMDTSGFSEVTLELVDGFDRLATQRLTPGTEGNTPPDESVGDIYYEGGSTTPAQNVFKHVDQRQAQALDDAGWPGTGNTIDVANLRNIFSGNCSVQEEVYARDGQLVEVVEDAADAEQPDISRCFFSREGVYSFRGRFARLNPENPGYGIGSWELGGAAEAAADADVVLLTDFEFGRSDDDVYNVGTALPKGLDDADVPGNTVEDAASITKYGRRPWMADNLLTWEGHTDLTPTNAAEETLKHAQFVVANKKDPKTRVDHITVKWRHPDSFSGPAAWEFLNGVELGDLVHVETTHRGGGGFDEDYFIEAIRELDEPAEGDLHKVTMELDVSPRSFYEDDSMYGEVDVGVS